MDQVTQQNAALVEEAAAAAESLKEQAELLTESVRLFKTEGDAIGSSIQKPSHKKLPQAAFTQRKPAMGKPLLSIA